MATFDIIFRGDLMPGFQLADVKRNLAALFKADTGRIDALFNGAAVPLKRDLDEATAQKYLAVLKKAGADVQLATAGSVGAARRRPATPTPQAQPGVSPPVIAQPSMQERLASTQQAAAAPQPETSSEPAVTAAVEKTDSGFSLAPIGAALVETPAPQALVAPATGHLSLRAQEGNLVDDAEIKRPRPVVVAELDVGLREAGASLLDESERQVPVTVAVADLAVDLAPTGSDLGQIRRPAPPPPPDTSGIQLLDN